MIAVPLRPYLPLRPILWIYVELSLGKSKLITNDNCWISIPLDSKSVDNNTLILPVLNSFNIKENEKILLIEDVLSTGGSIKEVIELISKHKGNVVGVGVIVDRSLSPLFIHDNFYSITTQKAKIFDKDNIPEELKGIPAIKPGSNV